MQDIGNCLRMRSIADETDIRRFVEFNTRYNGIPEGLTCECVLRHHPEIRREDFILVEDSATGELVSTTCRIPWTLEYDGIPLKSAMLEMVLTHPDYRGKGLVRHQIRQFSKVVEEQQYDLEIIWGIPYYYRQFGYAYCMDGNSSDSLPVWRIPDVPGDNVPVLELRRAEPGDIPLLTEMYGESMKLQQIHVMRDASYWEYLLRWAHYPVWLVMEKSVGKAVGYVVMQEPEKADRLLIQEHGITGGNAGLALLRLLKRTVREEISVAWPEDSPLVRLARSLGSTPQPGGQWLWRIPDLAGFLQKIGPSLEKRLEYSECSGLTGQLLLNLFREAYILYFSAGKLTEVENAGFVDTSMGADGGDLCIPPDAFLRLLFGFRSLETLADAWPDIRVKPEARRLLEVLFPRGTGYIHTPYHFQQEAREDTFA